MFLLPVYDNIFQNSQYPLPPSFYTHLYILIIRKNYSWNLDDYI